MMFKPGDVVRIVNYDTPSEPASLKINGKIIKIEDIQEEHGQTFIISDFNFMGINNWVFLPEELEKLA